MYSRPVGAPPTTDFAQSIIIIMFDHVKWILEHINAKLFIVFAQTDVFVQPDPHNWSALNVFTGKQAGLTW